MSMPLGSSPGVQQALSYGSKGQNGVKAGVNGIGSNGTSHMLMKREPLAPYAVDYCTHKGHAPRAQSGKIDKFCDSGCISLLPARLPKLTGPF